jgi:arylsulfatase A-like enzyme
VEAQLVLVHTANRSNGGRVEIHAPRIRVDGMARRLAIVLLTAAVSAALFIRYGAAADSAIPDPVAPRTRPDILLVTIDALRADHLGSYGYSRLTSPAIDEFARGAVRFDNAIAQAPYTKASIASLMTGLYPSTHKTVSASVPFPETMTGHVTTAPIATDVLPPSATTLAEALRASGYRTLGFTANPFLIEAFGFGQGFDQFRFYPGPDFAGADRLVADALEAVRRVDPQRPRFVWVHFMEPHSPYAPPHWTAGSFKLTGAPEPIAAGVQIPGWLLAGAPRDRRPYVAAYDEEIAAGDAAFDTLIRQFGALRSGRETVVVLTADHGEQFLDHDGWEHGTNLHDELVRVPLAIKAPGAAPAIVQAQVQLIDLFPTLLGLAGVDAPPTAGRNLMGVLQGKSEESPAAFSEIVGFQYAVRDEGFKLIAYNDRRAQLFDVVHDPHEHHDLAATEAARVRDMRPVLDRMLAEALRRGRDIRADKVAVDPAVAERLRSLGYGQR